MARKNATALSRERLFGEALWLRRLAVYAASAWIARTCPMRLLWRSIKATVIAIPALVLLFVLLFPPTSRRELEETMGWMTLAVIFLGLPLFIAILLFNTIFNRSPAVQSPPIQRRSAPTDAHSCCRRAAMCWRSAEHAAPRSFMASSGRCGSSSPLLAPCSDSSRERSRGEGRTAARCR